MRTIKKSIAFNTLGWICYFLVPVGTAFLLLIESTMSCQFGTGIRGKENKIAPLNSFKLVDPQIDI